jgi:hypothetical protein
MFLMGFASMSDFLQASKGLRDGSGPVNIWVNLQRTSEYPVAVAINMSEARVTAHALNPGENSAASHFQVEIARAITLP